MNIEEKTISEIEAINSDLLNKNEDYKLSIDKLLKKIKSIRNMAKENRHLITLNKNIIKKRLGNTIEFNKGDKFTFDISTGVSYTNYYWIGSFRVNTKNPTFEVCKINDLSVRVKYKNHNGITVDGNISKDNLRRLILQKSNIISKKAIIRDEEINKILN